MKMTGGSRSRTRSTAAALLAGVQGGQVGHLRLAEDLDALGQEVLRETHQGHARTVHVLGRPDGRPAGISVRGPARLRAAPRRSLHRRALASDEPSMALQAAAAACGCRGPDRSVVRRDSMRPQLAVVAPVDHAQPWRCRRCGRPGTAGRTSAKASFALVHVQVLQARSPRPASTTLGREQAVAVPNMARPRPPSLALLLAADLALERCRAACGGSRPARRRRSPAPTPPPRPGSRCSSGCSTASAVKRPFSCVMFSLTRLHGPRD